jgi:hypothetical protein
LVVTSVAKTATEYTSIWGIGANWEHMCFASMSKQFESAILHHK